MTMTLSCRVICSIVMKSTRFQTDKSISVVARAVPGRPPSRRRDLSSIELQGPKFILYVCRYHITIYRVTLSAKGLSIRRSLTVGWSNYKLNVCLSGGCWLWLEQWSDLDGYCLKLLLVLALVPFSLLVFRPGAIAGYMTHILCGVEINQSKHFSQGRSFLHSYFISNITQ